MKPHARPRVSKRLRAVAEPKKGPEAFEPPKYLASLIASINDGAKAAQTGALFFAFIGLYLLAVAFSTTDEDLLRERTIAISQLGMAVPVVFSFAVAPLIFVFLHIHTLIRYDMLSANLRQFDREVAGIVDEENRERCRHLLANVEFLRGLAVRPGSPLASRLFHFTGWFMLAGFPLFVLTVIQLSALRYQDSGIVWTQRGAIIADAAAIVWFVRRKWRLWDDAVIMDVRQLLSRSFRRDFLFAIVLGLLVFNFAWMGVPGPDETTVGHKAIEDLRRILRKAIGSEPERSTDSYVAAAGVLLSYGWKQPVDLGLCLLRFGCRYLRVPHTLLMAVNPSAELLARLRTARGKASDGDLASLEGLNLRGRTLRFIELHDSRLYEAALTDADLRGASLRFADLQGAYLAGADLQGAYLGLADLRGTYLGSADLRGAHLFSADPRGADLAADYLREDADPAQLQGANFYLAQVQGANLGGADLRGADLFSADLRGTNLRAAQLQGAYLGGAQLQGADLRKTQIWQAEFIHGDLNLADFRSAQFAEPTDNDRAEILTSLDAILDGDRRAEVVARVKEAFTPQPSWDIFLHVDVDKFVLVDDLREMRWRAIAQDKKTSDEAEYDRALAPYLAELATTDEFVATGIANRATVIATRLEDFQEEERKAERERALWPKLARLMLDGRNTGRIKLPNDLAAALEKIAALAAEAAAPLKRRQP